MDRRSPNSKGTYRLALPALFLMLIITSVLVSSLVAQNPPAQMGGMQMQGPPPVTPNWDLAARWTPAKVGKLVFDAGLTPHWFELSDRFWYTYETTDGVRYWVVDPAKKGKSPLFDNAKVAAQLSLLTGLPYDAQHLAIRKDRKSVV